jgi:hypothetical protein
MRDFRLVGVWAGAGATGGRDQGRTGLGDAVL